MAEALYILMPTHGRPTLLERTLESLEHCQLPSSYEALIVIENGSRAGSEALVRKLPPRLNARYMHVQRGNKSQALNRGLEHVPDRSLVVFFDDDVRVHPETLVAYNAAAEAHPSGVYFGGPVQVDREQEPPAWLEPLLPYSARGYDLLNERMGKLYLGFNWAAYAKDLKALGGFALTFGPGSPSGAVGQEVDMQSRMQKQDVTGVDVLDALVWHYVPASRCNAQWLLRRSFKNGIREGLVHGTEWTALSAVKDILKYAARWLVYTVAMNELEVYRTKLALQWRAGFLRGYLSSGDDYEQNSAL